MTLSSPTMRVSYAGNGATVAFTAPFLFLASADLVVLLRVADGTETTLVETTNYTVAGAGDPAGGTVTLLVAPAVGETLVILRDPPLTQETDYIEAEKFPAETHERALDKLTMIEQRTRDLVGRALTLGDSDVDGSGAFRGGGNRIADLGAPIDTADAVRKADLDAAISGVGGTLPYLEFAEIVSPSDPVADHLRLFAKDVGGATRLFTRDSSGAESNLSALPIDIAGLDAVATPAADDEVPLRDVSAPANGKITLRNLLKVVNTLDAESAPAGDDLLALYDLSAGAADKIALADLFKVVNGLPEITAGDENADFLLAYDASDGAAKKIKPLNLPSGRAPIASFTHSVNVATVDFTNIPSGFGGLLVLLSGVTTSDAAAQSLNVRVSTDNGASFQATGYGGIFLDDEVFAGTTPATEFAVGTIAAAGNVTGAILLAGHAGVGSPRPLFVATNMRMSGQYVVSGPVNALRFSWSAGNIDGGSIQLIGLR